MKKRLMTAFAFLAFLGLALPASAQELKAKHQAAGLECAACHGQTRPAQGQFEPAPSAQCLSCHGPAETLAKRTDHLSITSKMVDPKTGAKSEHKAQTNPHNSFHFSTQLDCYECHREHRPSTNVCATCHDTQPWGMKLTP
ncbi:MAG: cytochrome c3 family protein [Burkholderiaceae bacterium]